MNNVWVLSSRYGFETYEPTVLISKELAVKTLTKVYNEILEELIKDEERIFNHELNLETLAAHIETSGDEYEWFLTECKVFEE